jgi:hypothetical protein
MQRILSNAPWLLADTHLASQYCLRNQHCGLNSPEYRPLPWQVLQRERLPLHPEAGRLVRTPLEVPRGGCVRGTQGGRRGGATQ